MKKKQKAAIAVLAVLAVLSLGWAIFQLHSEDPAAPAASVHAQSNGSSADRGQQATAGTGGAGGDDGAAREEGGTEPGPPQTFTAKDIKGWEWISTRIGKKQSKALLESLSWYFTQVEGEDDLSKVSLSAVRHRNGMELDEKGKPTKWAYYLEDGKGDKYYQAELDEGVWDVFEVKSTVPGVNISEKDYREAISKQDRDE